MTETHASSFTVTDPQAFVQNMAKLYEEYGKAVAASLEPRKETPLTAPLNANDFIKTFMSVAESWARKPETAVALQTELWTNYARVFSSAMQRMMGGLPHAGKAERTAEAAAGPDNLFFDLCKQIYQTTTQWAEASIEQAEGLDPITRDKALFYANQITAALSPDNFVMTNPEIFHETLSSNGQNLVRGMAMMAEDLKAGHGALKLRQTDESAFELGTTIAATKGSVVFQNDLMQLLQYAPATTEVFRRPVLIVPPWINKYYILDLSAEKSLIKWLVDQGHTVFCISWVNPTAEHRYKGLTAYYEEGLRSACQAVSAICKDNKINLVGYCVGGTLLAAGLALMSKDDKIPLGSATFFTAQTDFSQAGNLKYFTTEEQIGALEQVMNALGYLPAQHMAMTFNMLRANDLIWPYFINNYLRGKTPQAFDLLYWNSDSTRLAAACHSEYLRQCYLTNALAEGKMKLAGKTVNLKDMTVPVYSLATQDDHIAPARSVFNGTKLFGGPVTFVLSASGHIAGVINPPSKQKYKYWTNGASPPTLDAWTAAADEHAGSWWPHWHDWLVAQDRETCGARPPGAGMFKALEPAPGSYVRMK